MPVTITCRRPADLVAAAIGVLGFVPEESVVMLTFGASAPFHARVDLDLNYPEVVAEALLNPVVRHGVTGVAFLVFTDDGSNIEMSRNLLEQLVSDFSGYDVAISVPPLIVVAETIHFTDGTTQVCDWRSNPAVASLVAQGRRIESSRHALQDRVRSTNNALIEGPAAIADLLRDLFDADIRNTHLMALTRADAREQLEYWLDATRRAPDTHAAAPSAIAGFAAWLTGDGALAWVCVDRAQEADPGNRLAAVLAEILTACANPATWDDLRATFEPTQ